MSKERRLLLLQIFLLLLFGLMVGAGVLTGEAETVFRKASMICMECIGIGRGPLFPGFCL